MTRIHFLVPAVAAALGLALAGCVGAAGPAPATGDAPSSTPAASAAPTTPETPPPMTGTPITLTVGGTTVTGTLGDNAAAASLIAQLPLELDFVDFGGQEKIADLPAPLSLDGMPSGGSASPGTIGYYAPDQALVLYYDSVGYFTGIIPLGTFDGVATVRDSAPFTGTLTERG